MSQLTEKEAIRLLKSRLPSERAQAAEWCLIHAGRQHSTLLAEAIASEPVPSIKRLLGRAANRSRTQEVSTPTANETSNAATPMTAEILDSLSGLLRHETEPVIGWLRRSAAKDIGPEYATTETFRNIDLLRRRLLGLEALAAAHRVPRWTRLSLSKLIADCRPTDLPLEAFGAPANDDDVIDSDSGLLSIIVSNALLNAYEASGAENERAVWVESGVTDRDFWLSVTNRFLGEGFEFEHFAHSGASSKDSHKGLGLSAMRLAADRLGYDISLKASGGTAFFSMRGGRFHE